MGAPSRTSADAVVVSVTSARGTCRSSCDVRSEAAIEVKADVVATSIKDQLVYISAMSHKASLQSPRGRPRSFDTEAAVERAMGVFWSRGYHATALPDLLRATKLSRGSLYAAFGDKHSLFLRALDRHVADALTRMDIELDPLREPVEGLRADLAGYVDRTSGAMAGADACWWPQPWNWLAMMLKSIVASGAFSKPWRPGWLSTFPCEGGGQVGRWCRAFKRRPNSRLFRRGAARGGKTAPTRDQSQATADALLDRFIR